MDLILASSSSKLIASTVTYPHEVVRAQLQDYRGRISIVQVVRHIWRAEGLGGFYRGLRINALRVLPSCVTTMVTYEKVKDMLLREP